MRERQRCIRAGRTPGSPAEDASLPRAVYVIILQCSYPSETTLLKSLLVKEVGPSATSSTICAATSPLCSSPPTSTGDAAISLVLLTPAMLTPAWPTLACSAPVKRWLAPRWIKDWNASKLGFVGRRPEGQKVDICWKSMTTAALLQVPSLTWASASPPLPMSLPLRYATRLLLGSAEELFGVWLSGSGQTAKMSMSSLTMSLFHVFLRASIEVGLYVVVLGRPTNSIWDDCQFRISLRRGRLQFSHLAFCRFGAPYWENGKIASNMPDGTFLNLQCSCRGEHERVQGRILRPNSGGEPPRWVWKHTVADELPSPFCRYFAALVARVAPGSGWRRLGEPRCLPWWRQRLGLDRAVAPTCRGRRLHAWAGALDHKLCGAGRASPSQRRALETHLVATRRQPTHLADDAPLEGLLPPPRVSARTQPRHSDTGTALKTTHHLNENSTAARVDKALDKQLVAHFLAGLPASAARCLYYGVRWHYVLRDSQLGLAHASLTGFVRRSQDAMRDPETWEATLLTAFALLSLPSPYDPNEAAVAAAAVLLQFALYSRPPAPLAVMADDVTVVKTRARRACAVSIFPAIYGSSCAPTRRSRLT